MLQLDQEEVSMQVPKASRTEVRSREISSGCGVRAGVRSERGSAGQGSKSRSAMSDSMTRNSRQENGRQKRDQANRRQDTRH